VIYVGGWRVVQPDPELRYSNQLDWIDGPIPMPANPVFELVALRLREQEVSAAEDATLREVALGGPDTATRRQTVWQARLERLGEANAEITCATVPDWGGFVDESTARLRARAQPETTSADPCTIPPGAGYRRLENQLYRVEIHDSGNVGAATFKWSRENGSVVVGAQVTDTDEITVTSTGRDEVLGIVPGSWVELTDETHELGGEPGTLVQVKSVTGNILTVDTSSSGNLDAAAYPTGPKVRRWDDPAGARKVTIPGANDGFLALEDGVEVRFEAGRHYENGDYWRIPARTATGDVEWPENGGSPAGPLPRPPEGIAHHYCKLALLRFDGKAWEVVEDCRKLFPPLTDLGGLQRDPGVHVVRIRSSASDPLRNDSDLLVTDFVKGIEIQCDANLEPNTLANKPTLFFTLDLPFPLNPADQGFWGKTLVGTVPLTLDGFVRVKGDTIRWQPTDAVARWLLGLYRKLIVGAKLDRSLLHLTLKGNFVYGEGDPTLDVDGEAFGKLEGGTLDAMLPSGNGRRGGNLDLWFWLRPRATGSTDRIVLVPIAKATSLTTVARRTSLGTMVAAGVDRTRLLEALPASFQVDTKAESNPAQARSMMTRMRLATTATVQIAVEESLAPAADVILAELRANGITTGFELTPVGDLVAELPNLVERGFDGVIASQETVDAIIEAHPGVLDLARAKTL
jgi:hypothetical protein